MRAAVGNALNISWNINSTKMLCCCSSTEVTISRADIIHTSFIQSPQTHSNTPSHTLHSTKSPPNCQDQSSGATRNAGTDISFSYCITEPKRLIIKPIIRLSPDGGVTFWEGNEHAAVSYRRGNEMRSWATDLSWVSPSPAWLMDKKRTARREKKRKEIKSAALKKERKMCEGLKLTSIIK